MATNARNVVLPSLLRRLINPTNKNNPGHGLVKKPTKNWYLPLNKYQDWLKKWILEGHKEWRTNVYGQCKSLVGYGSSATCDDTRLGLGYSCSSRGCRWKGALRLVRCTYRLHLKHQGAFAMLIQKSGEHGRSGGRILRLVSFTSSVRTISCSTASSSLLC